MEFAENLSERGGVGVFYSFCRGIADSEFIKNPTFSCFFAEKVV